jgi:hypothetical protein
MAAAIPAAALMLGAAHGATTVGLNFQSDAGSYTSYSGKPVTGTAFGIETSNWFNLTPTPDYAISTNSQTIALPSGGEVTLTWRANNAYESLINNDGAFGVTPGEDEVFWGYLDDTGPGYQLKISGLRGVAADYRIVAIAATDGGAGFSDVTVKTVTETNVVNYTDDPGQTVPVGGAAWATSTVSTAFATLSANDSVTIAGLPRNGSTRSTLAGIILQYTPGVNPPLVETQPTTPAGTIFKGTSFVLSSAASGTAPLAYQWRLAGTPIAGATNAAYTNLSAVVADMGDYDVVVTNLYGMATSSAAAVTVTDVIQPTITTAPLSRSAYPGYDFTFRVVGSGGSLSYVWKKGADPIPGATGASLVLSNVMAADAGTYTVTVSNPVGGVDSSATLAVLTPGAYDGAVASLKPFSYFRLNETGTIPSDTAANAGSLGATGAGLYRSGAVHPVSSALASGTGMAAHFDGSASHVLVPYSMELHTATFTFETWLKPDVELTGTTLKTPISGGDFASPRAGWLVYQTATNWNLRLYDLNGTATSLDVYGGPAPVAGTWYHVAGTYDGATAALYVNGQVVASGTPSGFVTGTIGGFAVGMRADSAFQWAGAADEPALYATALSATRILAHYQAGTNAPAATAYSAEVLADSPTVYLKLDEPAFEGKKSPNVGTWGPVYDGVYGSFSSSLSADPGIYLGVDGPRPPGVPGFEADNKALQMTNGTVNLGVFGLNTNVLTITCWVKRDAAQPGDLAGLVFERSSTEATGLHMMPDGELRYHWNDTQYGWSSGLIPPEGQWTFVALVVEPTRATMYMDDGSGLVSAVNSATHVNVAFSSSMNIGNDRITRPYAGSIDEVAVFNRPLSAGEISLLSLAASGNEVSLALVPGGVIQDVKPTGTLHHGFSHATAWTNSFTDSASVTRTGVRKFSASEGGQVTVPADPDFDSTTGTIMFWMQAAAPIPGPGNEAAILFDRRSTTGDVIALDDFGAIFVQAKGAGGASANTTSGGYLPDELWHHVAYVYDQSASGSIKVYVDGVLTIDNPNTIAWSWPADRPLEIGRSHDGYWKRFDGLMDDFRVYNRVLSESEVGQVFRSSALVDSSALRVRFDFDNGTFGKSVVWQYGTLESTTFLGPAAPWAPVPGATSPFSFLPEHGGAGLFFRTRVP